MIADHAEGTFVLLRYSLGGNRPSQTNSQTLFLALIQGIAVRWLIAQRWYFKVGSLMARTIRSTPPTYPTHVIQDINIRLQ